MKDSGAHFHKCDFQVHTPRDINWSGDRPVTDDDRRQYAMEFVAACRDKELGAVAITDHHDVAFFKFIREAALVETDSMGKPLAPADRLAVFPGMELSLGIPCQALLIFDADLPTEFLQLAQAALGIIPADPSDPKHGEPRKLDIMSFEILYEALDKLDPLRGRYIALPNIGDGGYKTLLRKDFEKHYISMPCVGGYVDGELPAPPKSQGLRNITNGLDKNWGNKPIGLFQTSDSRSRDFADLGKHVTWVKWARPTAEALRQACLARHSRISHTAPRLPSIRITRVEVSNSKFLGPVVVEFNPQYNAIIGGRGTGKSTILEYVRWALCDQPPGDIDGVGADLADFNRRRKSLIEGTLLPLDAVVDIAFLLSEVPHVVRRKATGELTLKIGDAPYEACTEQNVRELLPIHAYSQKQLSAVGARLDELRRFVNAPVQAQLDTFEESIASLAITLRASFDNVIRTRALREEIAAHDFERRSLKDRIDKLRSSLIGLSAEDTAIIARQALFEAEQRIVQNLENDRKAARDALSAAAGELQRLPSPVDFNIPVENHELLTGARMSLAKLVADMRERIRSMQETLDDPASEHPFRQHIEDIEEWRSRRAAHLAEYEQAKMRAAVHEETLLEMQTLEGRLAEINESADAKSQQLARLGDPSADFDAGRSEWKNAHRERADILEARCRQLTEHSRSKLRATLRRAADTGFLAEKLKQILRGTNTRGDKVDNLVAQITLSEDPPDLWHSILDELLALAWLRVEDDVVVVLPTTPRLDSAGFIQKDKISLARKLQPPEWLSLLLFDLKDLPVFEYQVREGDFLPFDKVSPGQQATALLSILLLQDGPPLLIDQPEDDLNMKVINEVVETLWKAKSHRQVIFTSHNANLVVNGDAELVICCDYRTTGTESGGHIKFTGAIDISEVNREIAEVMEGGVDAFKLRHEKYGF